MIEKQKDDKHSENGNDTKPIVTGSGSSSKVVMAQCDDCGRDIMDDEVALNRCGIHCWECCKKLWGMD